MRYVQLALKYQLIQDEFTGLFYDPYAITKNLIKTSDQMIAKNNKNGNSNNEKDSTDSKLNK